MKRGLIVLLILSLFSVSCSYNKKDIDIPQNQDNIKEEPLLSLWTVYWDFEHASNEIEYIKPIVGEISYFAAYFNENSEVFIPENITKLQLSSKSKFKDTDILHYISIVNDRINKDGSTSLKDKELLYNLLTDEKNRKNHMDNLINICIENDYDGIEIDYEGLKDDELLWPYFLEFCNDLYQSLALKGLEMRIVLEPSAPIGDYDFPEGPDYVVMCYNLHGPNSKPGPKANREFLQHLSQKTKGLPGKINFALATGGFDWDSEGNITSITEEKGFKLMEEYNAAYIRDEESQCIVYNYKDKDSVEHEVWFADATTLSYWIDILQSEGNTDFSLWRLGGNRKESLSAIKTVLELHE